MIPQAAIRNALRKLWLYSPMRRDAIKRARVARGVYQCSSCTKGFPAKHMEIDHLLAVGKTPGSRGSTHEEWNGFMARLFCPAYGLIALCKICHLQKREAK